MSRARRVDRRRAALGSVMLAISLLAGCSSVINGTASSIYSDPNLVAGLRVNNGPSGPRAGVAPTDLAVQGGTGAEIDQLAANAVADVQTYWQQTYPTLFNAPLTPVDTLVSYDSNATSAPAVVCGASTANLINAFYCPSEELIAWDRGQLLPAVKQQFTAVGIMTVLAHEYGHAIATQAAINPPGTATIVGEQQADCFGGAFMRAVAEGRAAHFTLNTSGGLNAALATTVAVRDKVGTAASSRDAHGSAFDRVSAFQFGFSDGPGRCVAMTSDEVGTRTTKIPSQFDRSGDTGDLPVDERDTAAVVASLNEAFQANHVPAPTVSFTGSGACADAATTPPVSYCPASNTLAVNVAELAARAKAPRSDAGSALSSEIKGDFRAYILLASRYTLSVQNGLGAGLRGELVGLRSACYAGSYATATTSTARSLHLSPGDLDEAVSGLLTDGLAASDVDGREAPSGFTRVQAFRTGVLDGSHVCATVYR